MGDWFCYCCVYLFYRPETWSYQSVIKWKKFVTHWQASRVTPDHPHTILMTTKKLVHLLATTPEMIILVTKNQPGTQMFGHPQPQWSIGKPSKFQKSCKILQLDSWFVYLFLLYLQRIKCTRFFIKDFRVLLIGIYLTYFITRKKKNLSFFYFLLILKTFSGFFVDRDLIIEGVRDSQPENQSLPETEQHRVVLAQETEGDQVSPVGGADSLPQGKKITRKRFV